MKIYTRTGDKGQTSLFTGKRIPKNDAFIQAIGIVDECNSSIGVAIAFLEDAKYDRIKEQLVHVQHALFDVGAALATPLSSGETKKIEKTRFDHDGTLALENWIDQMELELPKLQNFILPGGHKAAAFLHVSRSICRGAERQIVPLYQQEEISLHVMTYLNRLSDYLFMLTRYVNQLAQVEEVKWQLHHVNE